MTSSNTNLAGPNAIFLNIILAVIAFILIIYLRNFYVTIISIVVVVGVYLIFDEKALFSSSDNMATPYIESQPSTYEAPLVSTGSGSVQNADTAAIQTTTQSITQSNESTGCSNIDLNSDNVYTVSTYDELLISKDFATDSSKIIVLTQDINCGGTQIDGSFYETFSASFEGNCYTISNFEITGGSNERIGFFGLVKATTSIYIKNVKFAEFLINIQTSSAEKIGLIAE